MRFATLALLALAPAAGAADPVALFGRAKPVVVQFCGKCHNADETEGGADLTAPLSDPAVALGKAKLWRRAGKRLAEGEMPPDDAPQPNAAEKALLAEWFGAAGAAQTCDPAKRDPGPTPFRRLTRTEYRNSVQDLLGVEKFDPGAIAGVPDDGGGEGHFDTLAANLPLSPELMNQYFQAADAVLADLLHNDWRGEKSRKAIYGAIRPGPKSPDRDAARLVFERLVRRAYRRPPQPGDVDRLLSLYDAARKNGADFAGGIKAGLKLLLVSPRFLVRLEEERPGGALDAYEVAARLSYFLWSTMPDDELARLADAGELLKPEVVRAQVARMLADPRGAAFSENFGMQWLQVKKLSGARPTTEFFPAFNGDLKDAMRGEVFAFLEHLRTENRPVTDLLDADYTFANAALAKFYGLPGVTGDKPRKVPLRPEDRRGGLLGFGAVLAMTSHTFRTSPTQRGKYVLEVVFGTPPPPPPPNVPALADEAPDKKKKAPLTFKEQLAAHASQPSCAGCHAKIDPLGFALDNYNAVGAWRDGTANNPLDVSGTLPGGKRVEGVSGLKAVLREKKDDFARNVAARMLEYALGRELESSDDCAVDDVLAAMRKDGYTLRAAATEVALSVPFRGRRAGP